jgi:hypothetical protein
VSGRNWRDAKIPAWVRDDIEAEMRADKLRLALSWPHEPKPEPLPFRWGEYDRRTGEPVPGRYWIALEHRVEEFELAQLADLSEEERSGLRAWQGWVFRHDGRRWTTQAVRGALFATARDAHLYRLWLKCEAAAADLAKARKEAGL